MYNFFYIHIINKDISSLILLNYCKIIQKKKNKNFSNQRQNCHKKICETHQNRAISTSYEFLMKRYRSEIFYCPRRS